MKNRITSLAGIVAGGAIAYHSYKTGNYELILAGLSAAGLGGAAKDSRCA